MEEATRQLADLEEAESSEVVYIRGRTTVHAKPDSRLWTRWVRARAPAAALMSPAVPALRPAPSC